jgi:hypothetical protein
MVLEQAGASRRNDPGIAAARQQPAVHRLAWIERLGGRWVDRPKRVQEKGRTGRRGQSDAKLITRFGAVINPMVR